MRIDKYISIKNPSLSRTKIKELIQNGYIIVSDKIIDKPSYEIDENVSFSEVEITGYTESMKYVGRGGIKLEAALDYFNIDISGMKACDIGASTGGFTDCLLKRGAAAVYAVDSGHGQLHASLKNNEKVISIEGYNARNLTENETGGLCDIIVSDVSFISQTYIIPAASKVLSLGGIYICLIKPQFEAGKKYARKNGIVKDKEAHFTAVSNVTACAWENNLSVEGLIKSPILGGDGNTEFLMMCKKEESNGIKSEKNINEKNIYDRIKELTKNESCSSFPKPQKRN